jgi:hypothetical protein
MGLVAFIVKGSGSDCSAGGISSKYSKVCITNIKGPFSPNEDTPAVILSQSAFGNAIFVPEKNVQNHTMFGGAFVHTSDSRFNSEIEKLTGNKFYGAVPLHDRVEW